MQLSPSRGEFGPTFETWTGKLMNRSGAILDRQLLQMDNARLNAASTTMDFGTPASGYGNGVGPYIAQGTGLQAAGPNSAMFAITQQAAADASPVLVLFAGKTTAWMRAGAGSAINNGKSSRLFPPNQGAGNGTNPCRLLDNATSNTFKQIGCLEDDLSGSLTGFLAAGTASGQLDGVESGYFTGVNTTTVQLANVLFEGINGMR